jgi:hypothetical protein
MPTITESELRDQIDAVLGRHGLSLDEFIAAGHADELDGELRDLWLLTKTALEQD